MSADLELFAASVCWFRAVCRQVSADLELFADRCLPCSNQPRPRRFTPVLFYGRIVVISSSLQHDLYVIMVVQWSFPDHFTPVLYYGRTVVIPWSFHTCTLLWSYSGHSLINSAWFTTNWPRQRCQWWLVYICLIEVCLALGTKAETCWHLHNVHKTCAHFGDKPLFFKQQTDS